MTRPSSITDERYGADIDPPYFYPDYVGTRLRAPKEPLVIVPHTLTELTAPVFGESVLLETDGDLTRQHDEEPIGERVIVS
ncbi:MAG: protocatechuate 3,4-dioxygenase, beta subunit, partial [Gaiellaceae bacterium]|nr:protocatechuate 3,4-dioxygenase, beta subunit [Gaiellaceae bacterium]